MQDRGQSEDLTIAGCAIHHRAISSSQHFIFGPTDGRIASAVPATQGD